MFEVGVVRLEGCYMGWFRVYCGFLVFFVVIVGIGDIVFKVFVGGEFSSVGVWCGYCWLR